ncbi:response regulator [Microbacterium sp. gxy059]|uniref:response regulator n=1 Tax=Microbacterium sp. gxy059 TaxID=2957199 RepID=UPI003D97C69A
MALARLHGGPLDGQTIPLDELDDEQLILPFSEAQLVYRREGEARNTGEHDGPTEADFRYVEQEGDLVPDGEG